MPSSDNKYESRRENVGLENLYLDPNNYRLIHEQEYVEVPREKIKDSNVARRTIRLISGEKNQHIQDLIDSFKTNDYLPVDQIQVKKLEDGSYLVVEGNRRVAALKILESDYKEKGIDLGRLDPRVFESVPVVLYEDGDDLHHHTLMALKHISGNKKWAEWNQAKLLSTLHTDYDLSEDEICKRIGISKVELRRSLRALSFANQYQESDYGDQFHGNKFPIFHEVARNAALKDWLGWDDGIYKARNENNRELLFSWLSREPIESEDEDDSSGFGDRYHEPALTKRDEIRLLGKIIKDEKALARLKKDRDISLAYGASDLVFKERQKNAIEGLIGEITTLEKLVIQPENVPALEEALSKLNTLTEKARASGFSSVEQNEVFYDRIDKHFSSISIEQYKGLNGLSLENLSRINLIAGLNNSGKTSFLEAIYLLSRQNDFKGILDTIRWRGKIAEDRMNPEWLVTQFPGEVSLKGVFDGKRADVMLRYYKEESGEIDRASYLGTVEITTEYSQIKQESSTQIFKGKKWETQAGGIKLLSPSIFSSPFFLNEPHRYAGYYYRSVKSKSLQKILDFIRNRIVPEVSDIRLGDAWERFQVHDAKFPESMDLGSYGEGLQRIFYISLLFASARNGVLLIDEFENAIHADLILDFTKLVFELAELFNVQVFLTSHSKECIDAFFQGSPDVEQLTTTALVSQDGKIVPRHFSGSEFQKLLKAGDVDLRMAR